MLIATGLLVACSSAVPVQPWTTWVCDSQAEVIWRFADAQRRQVELRLAPSETEYRLNAEAAVSPETYSDGVLAFQLQGEQGLVYWIATDDLIGRGCKAPN
ncbi:MAG: MliC family protein [Pseudomonadota bacterium]